jgi:putative glutamate/gamma-aminobutyrate antiporter
MAQTNNSASAAGNVGKGVAPTVKMGVFTLIILNIVAVVSLRGLPAEATYGMSSAFYYLLAAAVFLIPVSLVAAEMAAMFPYQQGGVFRWVGEAFGKKLGFLAIWLQWIESTIWYPTVLTFGGVALAFIGMNHGADSSLAANKIYMLCAVLGIYWLATFISLKGMNWVGKVSKIGGMVGTVIPAAILIILAVIYLCMGGTSNLDFHGSFIPDFGNFDNVVLACSIFLFYAGMEMSGIHVREIKNPTKNYPKAVFIGAIVTVLIFIFGTYSLAIIIPEKDINLVQSLLVGFDNYFEFLHISWLSPVMAVALAFGVLAGVLTWVAGPSKGIFAVGRAGYLPPFFQKTNKNGVQKNILLVQGGLVTFLGLLLVLMPSVQSFYQILSQLTVILYLICYLLMFAAAIYLRYSMKDTKRPYRIGKKGNGRMWFVAGLGFIGSLAAFIFSFLPTNTMNMGSHTVWFAVLFGGVFVFVVLPFIILAYRKKSWLQPGNKFVPFHWEKSPEAQAALAQAAKDFEAEQAEEAAAEARLAAAKKNEDPGK